ncbi:rieske domain-containing protein [Ophiostoma piceae UAMH 11346]|uniref:Rieske domain-containing protein n=1 Tax=Ophiostoma piceae (strain UAMH 11346) TaxID=1262450 RepID=S3CUL6_OPHP1|nr:rieske domain-containing protein [Ophiostoma piceae UAMH 11346]
MFFPFLSSNQKGKNAWFCAGAALDFPDIHPPEDAAEVMSTPRRCGDSRSMPGCKVFHVTEDTATAKIEAKEVSMEDVVLAENTDALKDQVLVYRYKGRFIAVDHKCPHMSYPLSNGTPFDIEDFGIVLSAGLTCPKHGWSFDMFTGAGDRGNYKLKTWETELRDRQGEVGTDDITGVDAADAALVGKEVWVRKKQRIG